jgi:hypothetical protein
MLLCQFLKVEFYLFITLVIYYPTTRAKLFASKPATGGTTKVIA